MCAPVAQLDRAPDFGSGLLGVQILSGVPYFFTTENTEKGCDCVNPVAFFYLITIHSQINTEASLQKKPC